MIPPLRQSFALELDAEFPAVLGRWWLGDMLGQGSWARVFAAASCDGAADDFAYALKTPRVVDAAHRARLQAEVAVASEVDSPRLLGVLDFDLDAEVPYLTTPRLRGESAARRAESGRLRLADVVWIVRQAAEAVGAMHAAGWLHGDLTLDNLIVADDGSCTLIDYGLARRLRVESDAPLLQGTPKYLPPEVLQAGGRYDARGELYSLGVCLQKLLGALGERELAPLACAAKAYRLASELTAPSAADRPAAAGEVVRRLLDLELALLPSAA